MEVQDSVKNRILISKRIATLGSYFFVLRSVEKIKSACSVACHGCKTSIRAGSLLQKSSTSVMNLILNTMMAYCPQTKSSISTHLLVVVGTYLFASPRCASFIASSFARLTFLNPGCHELFRKPVCIYKSGWWPGYVHFCRDIANFMIIPRFYGALKG